MVKMRMAMRMVTIFMALIVCGMFFPNLARGEDLSVEQGLDMDFENVVVGEQKTIPLGITNQSGYELTLRLLLQHGTTCTYTINGQGALVVYEFAPDATLNVDVTFTALAEGECTGLLQIMYSGSPSGVVAINLSGNGIEETFEPPEIIIGGIPTGVQDRPINDEYNAPFVGKVIEECEATAYTCGQLRRCVSLLTGDLWRQRRLTFEEKCKLRRAAVRAEIRKVMQAMRTSARSGKSKHWGWSWRH